MSAPPSPRGAGSAAAAAAAAVSSSSSPPSSSSAAGDPEALRRMSKVINSLLARGDSGPFREPVDWRGLELYDYPKIIKKMMDLGTVKRKLERGQYRNAHECAEDIRLIWTNCKTYNADGSDFFLLAESFSRRFEDRYKKIKAELDTGEDPRRSAAASSSKGSSSAGGSADNGGGPATLEAKAKFGSSLFKLTGLEMGHVMQVIDLRCPQALVDPDLEGPDDGGGGVGVGGGGGGGAEVEIDVDAIDPRTFAELERYVREKVSPPAAPGGTGTGGPSSSHGEGGGGRGAGGRKRRGPSSAPKRRGSGVAAVQEEDDDDKDDEDDEEEEEEWQEDAGSKKRKR